MTIVPRPETTPSLPRDPRVDFFRGLAFIIIFVAHLPNNPWADALPGRFGLSDATEMFVFLSGYVTAIAFGATFRRSGFLIGTARIAYRIWNVYLAHLTLFFFVATLLVLANALFDTRDYVEQLYLHYFFDNTEDALLGFLTLRYVPNYFDVLPMYIVVLGMVPAMIALARVHPALAMLASLTFYGLALTLQWQLPAEVRPDSDRAWYFNPFGWQLLFFTGFALAAGWIRPPHRSRLLLTMCAAVVVVGFFLSQHPMWRDSPYLAGVRTALALGLAKTEFGPLRWVHFMALAYIAVYFLDSRRGAVFLGRMARPIIRCGQQSLAVFMFSMIYSQVAGILLDQMDRTIIGHAVANFGGIGLLIATAYLLGWLKSTPWRPDKPQRSVVLAGGHGTAAEAGILSIVSASSTRRSTAVQSA